MIENHYVEKEELMTEKEHRVMVNQLKYQQRRIYNDFAERIKYNSTEIDFTSILEGKREQEKAFF